MPENERQLKLSYLSTQCDTIMDWIHRFNL